MVAPLEAAIVRIRKSNGAIVGAGFLVHEKYVLTCAHVVAQALGISESTPQHPLELIHLDFPFAAPGIQLTAGTIFWRPAPAKGDSVQGHEDIAALELNSSPPPDAKPVRLLLEDNLWNHPFQALGFPAGYDDGLWSTGVIRARQATGWVQVEDVKSPGGRLEPGYSGTPIWDERLNGVVGMAVAADLKRTEAKIAFIIPTRILATTWTALAELTIPPATLATKKPNRSLQWIIGGLFTITALGSSTLLLPQVRDRLGLGEIACFREAEKNGEKAIAIAKFSTEPGTHSRDSLLQKELQEQLAEQKLPSVRFCFTSHQISDLEEAKKLGMKGATVVIWGRRENATLQVKITTPAWEVIRLSTLPIATENSSEFSQKTRNWPDLVLLMVAFKLSNIDQRQGRIQEGVNILVKALEQTSDKARLFRDDENTSEVFSRVYYQLGDLYAPAPQEFCSKQETNCDRAIAAYQKSFEWDQTFYQALITQGIIYRKMKQFSKAENSYTQVINLSTDSSEKLIARFNRANVYIEQGRILKAIDELKQLLEHNPQETSYLRLLGLAQLQSGKVVEAQETYEALKSCLSDSSCSNDPNNEREEVLMELDTLSRIKPNLLPTIKIISSKFR